MAYGIKSLRRIQLGRESTPGTIVAATTIWRGEGTLEDTREVVRPSEDVGLVPDTDRQYVPAYGGRLALPATPATFEQLGHIFDMGLHTAAASADGAGTDYIRIYTLPTTSPYSASDLTTYTVEGGDNAGAEVMEYAHALDFTLDFEAGQAVMLSGTLVGRQVATQAFTGALSVPTVEEILTSKGRVYIDDASGTIGTTQASNTILSGSLKVETGWRSVMTADGSLYFTFVKQVKPVITLELTFEHETKAIAEKAKWRAGEARLIRLLFEGSAAATAGTTYTYKTLQIDLAGKYSKFAALEDKDGNDIITATFDVGYNSTASLYAALTLVNELAALP